MENTMQELLGEVLKNDIKIRAKRTQRLADLCIELLDEIVVPEPNCSCHIAPPCSDCVNYGHLRDLVGEARIILTEIEKNK